MSGSDVVGRAGEPGRIDAPRAAVLIEVEELAALLAGGGAPPVLIDVRWTLGRVDGREQYLAGHLPGAVYVDLETELAAPATPAHGRHPLPDIAILQAAARRWGLHSGSPVVAYDESGGSSAARAWWLLRWAGVTGVRLLDGGLGAWRSAGGELERGDVTPAAGDVVLVPGSLAVLGADSAAALASTGVLLDARAGERYRGEIEPLDPRAGHIAGAVSAPTGENLDADGRFLGAEALRARFTALGIAVPDGDTVEGGSGPDATARAVPSVGVYCGSGVTAAHEAAALATLGIEAALYPGSWSQWSADPTRAVTTGPDPR
jgi:thiosulfate/3-mercaptopyruvate sulfurtransferase